MTKKKKPSKDEWVSFVNSIFAHKRANRKFTIPKDYLESLADKLWRINPTKSIVYNTLKDVYLHASNSRYEKTISDMKFFRDKQEQEFEKDWNRFKDSIDDMIHEKSKV